MEGCRRVITSNMQYNYHMRDDHKKGYEVILDHFNSPSVLWKDRVAWYLADGKEGEDDGSADGKDGTEASAGGTEDPEPVPFVNWRDHFDRDEIEDLAINTVCNFFSPVTIFGGVHGNSVNNPYFSQEVQRPPGISDEDLVADFDDWIQEFLQGSCDLSEERTRLLFTRKTRVAGRQRHFRRLVPFVLERLGERT